MGHDITNDGCIRYDYEKQGFTHVQTGMAADIIKTRCFIMSKDSNCDCQNNGTTFVANIRKSFFLFSHGNAYVALALTFDIDPMYHSFRFIEEGCEKNNCPS